MSAPLTYHIARISHLSALCGSVIAGLLLIMGLTIDSRIEYGFGNPLLNSTDFYGVRAIVGLLIGVIASYAIVLREKYTLAGSTMAIACVAVLFALCPLRYGMPLSPMVAFLALPACLHVLASQAQKATIEPEVVSLPNESAPVTNAEPVLAAG